ncbi:hypothetical protein [Pyxidicoccus xibeiensis]|uniref:hypothetical protein n=1 Tax=Pyxidicoccus xibeiensis TaxID=2906759 RepID=UPI0020A7448B|nr:hypothetical protein [Pyxidicoccus xibeiensis]MCP3143002.1 hypothetical protein [Pyxidicoccus xibeiensis]
MSRRKWWGWGAVLAVLTCLGCSGLLWSMASTGFLGTDKAESDFSPEAQRRLLDTFSPVPVPASATDVRIRYQGFQDWHLDLSFTLPPEDFDAYVAQLTPSQGPPDTYEGRTRLADGGFAADASSITVDRASRRVTLTASTR